MIFTVKWPTQNALLKKTGRWHSQLEISDLIYSPVLILTARELICYLSYYMSGETRALIVFQIP